MVTTSCVLQLRPGASPQSRGYVYTGPREVSSMVTDLPGTPVTPRIYKYIKYKKFYVYSDGTHTHIDVDIDIHIHIWSVPEL